MNTIKNKSNLFVRAYLIRVTGLVQGVGFRPFVFRLAEQFNIKGWVINQNDGVLIHAEAEKKRIDQFISTLTLEKPPASIIQQTEVTETEVQSFTDFQIKKSKNHSDDITLISPDIAVCNDCIQDLKIQKNRLDYAFVNCTNCGPRFSIIKDLPYDREMTTMQPFIMCSECRKEFEEVSDRRFHAQPSACNECGPRYELYYKERTIIDFNKIIQEISILISSGKILAIKGIGGFHLACDVWNDDAVKRLRLLKKRDSKPFAVMFKNIHEINKIAYVNSTEHEILNSWQRPIVLLTLKANVAIPESVSNKLETIGVMLPYLPFHHLLFERLNTSGIVLTSGNISDEPIVIDNDIALNKLSKIADAVLTYNRDIFNRTDDSVMICINKKSRIIRRSRGFVPTPIMLKLDVNGIFAAGAELKNTFCVGKNKMAFVSQHIGDLKNIETFDFYKETIDRFKKLFRVEPTLFVGDLHPDYLSTRYMKELKGEKIYVQHHHAHVASCMAEHGLDEQVIGVSFDGTGFGDDGHTWGSEFFVCDLLKYKRVRHFEYIPMPGADKVSEEPWRMAVSYLYTYYGEDFMKMDIPFLKNIPLEKMNILAHMLKNNIHCPLTSGAGRLFDAIAALMNICPVAHYEAEGPMRMESIIDQHCKDKYHFTIESTISFKQLFNELIDDINNNISKEIISAKFHNTIISVIQETILKIRDEYSIDKVVLSGGVFQNKYLLENTEKQLSANGLIVFSHQDIPSNDGGVSLGQLAIAAKRREVLSCKVNQVKS